MQRGRWPSQNLVPNRLQRNPRAIVAAARTLYPAAFELQQQLLSAAPLGPDARESGPVVAVAVSFLQRPIEHATAAGWLADDDPFRRRTGGDPPRMAPKWLLDDDGELRAEWSDTYELRGRPATESERRTTDPVDDDLERAFANLTPSA